MTPNIPVALHVSLGNVTVETLPQLIDLHSRIFPVNYGQRFYDDVLNAGELAKLIYYGNFCAGAICCRVEASTFDNYTARLYLMTLGVLKNYRNMGLGSILIEYIMEYARQATSPIITSLYLHVQTVNESAIRFYTRNGFRIQSIVHDYYRLVENRDAYLLARPVFRYENQ